MAGLSRRAFLNGLAGFSAAAALPTLATQRRGSTTSSSGTVTFEIKFTGPFGFIPDGNYIYVCAPDTTFEHIPVARSDSGEWIINDGNDYELTGIQPSANAPQSYVPPLTRSVKNPLGPAKDNCRIGIQVPQPDMIKGINTALVKVDGASQSWPTGLRFVYNNIDNAAKPLLHNARSKFDPDFKSYDRAWELSIHMVPDPLQDPCHKAARTSFGEVAALCSAKPIPALDYGDPAHCHGSPHRFGPGSDCQTLSLWINPV